MLCNTSFIDVPFEDTSFTPRTKDGAVGSCSVDKASRVCRSCKERSAPGENATFKIENGVPHIESSADFVGTILRVCVWGKPPES